jgi:hypothetical protein
MRPSASAVFLAISAACARPGSGPVVAAPTSSSASPSRSTGGPVARTAGNASLLACEHPWSLDVIGGNARVVVVCDKDVQRRALDESSAVASALAPALEPARQRVCGCVGRLRPPPFIDLVFTAKPQEGAVTVRASGDDDLDPELGPDFIACIGTVVAKFVPSPSDVCAGAASASYLYPVRLELDQ